MSGMGGSSLSEFSPLPCDALLLEGVVLVPDDITLTSVVAKVDAVCDWET